MRVQYDLSPRIHPGLAVWPGDRPFQRHVAMSIHETHLELSGIETTLHLGSHADAPLHVRRDGVGIGERDLAPYLGTCEVIRVRMAAGTRFRRHHLPKTLSAPRILVDTGTFPDPDVWTSDYASPDPELVHALADEGVVLLGLDVPSLDPFSSTSMDTHLALFERGLAVLEGLVLGGVPEGCYTLVAAPLRLAGADASPVRALLVDPTG